ncbi:MAG TPA: inorganic diphosphatase [Pyrinomonadaceae bacterium]|nr:inorganic diphosphatase [Pyrinomonadaceae bacterium]
MTAKSFSPRGLTGLDVYASDSDELNVIIETPKGSRNKYNYDEKHQLFKLGGVLPAGAVFPFDFGFIPSTVGGDGDPVDVLLLMDEPAFPGCLVPSRLVAVIEAEQTERDGETTRNDRLIAVAADSRTHREVRTLADISTVLLDEIEHFFISYNEIKGKKFKPLGRFGPIKAARLIEEGAGRFRRRDSGKSSGGRKRAGKKR